MSNYNFNVTLDGLNNVNANDINTDNIVTDYLTVTKNSSVPLVTPYTSNTNQIASCAFVQDAFINQLLNYVTLDSTQTIAASKTFNVAAYFNGGFQIRDQPAYTNMSQCFQSGVVLNLQNNTANGKIKINSTNSLVVATNNILLENGNHIVLQGIINQGIDILNDQITMNGNLTLNKPFIFNYIYLSSSIF